MHLLALCLLQAPLPVEPPAMSTTPAQEWTLGGVLRVKRHDFLRWQPMQDLRLHIHVVPQPIFLVEVTPLRRDRLVFSLASAPALASGLPGVASARVQLRLSDRARIGLMQGFVGGFTSAPSGNVGAFRGMRGAPRGMFSLAF